MCLVNWSEFDAVELQAEVVVGAGSRVEDDEAELM
jgi:hypothetical protein